jgi:putative membrane protein
VKFWLRWPANGIAIFLALYLADSLLHDRFHLAKTWPAVLAAIFLGLVNSFIKPLHRGRSKPQRAALAAVLILLVNALVLQLFVWVGADVSSRGFVWVLLAAALVTVVAGLINWQIGFGNKEKPRSSLRDMPGASAGSGGRRPVGSRDRS